MATDEQRDEERRTYRIEAAERKERQIAVLERIANMAECRELRAVLDRAAQGGMSPTDIPDLHGFTDAIAARLEALVPTQGDSDE